MLVALATACKPQPPPDLAEVARRLDFGATPLLPSPESGTYYPSDDTPRDPIVARLVRGKRYDGALAGAAAGLALAAAEDAGDLTRWELREAMWRAGWPYGAFDARRWNAREGSAPGSDLFEWIASIPDDQPMGLVRARGAANDIWVGIRAQPRVQLEPIPRRAQPGTVIRLPAIEDGVWLLSDGGGALTRGELTRPAELLLTSAGEWLLLVKQGTRELARFPIYVGIEPPSEPVLRTGGERPVVGEAADADAWARTLLTHVRRTYGLLPWAPDPLLDAAAREFTSSPERGSARAVAAVGVTASTLRTWQCDDVTVENCLDSWIWDPRLRETLLDRGIDTYGLHTRLDTRGLHLTLVLADTE